MELLITALVFAVVAVVAQLSEVTVTKFGASAA